MSQLTASPADPVGAETLEVMQAARRYNRWQYSRIAPYLGRRICEVGSGIGNMSTLLRELAPDLLVLTDTDTYYREALRNRFSSFPNVAVDELTLPDRSAGRRFQPYALDTVVILNVLEHIAEDVEALRSIAGMLRPAGRVIVLVPAFPALFGSLDEGLGHVRRYTRRGLKQRMELAGFQVERAFYFNLVGTLGWWFNARVRKLPRIPLQQVRFLDDLVPVLRLEDRVPLPFGQSVIAVGIKGA